MTAESMREICAVRSCDEVAKRVGSEGSTQTEVIGAV